MSVFSLETRVAVLESNGGNGDNSSIPELELRVTELEIQNENQEEQINSNTQSIEGTGVL